MRRLLLAAVMLSAIPALGWAGPGTEVIMHSFAGGADGANPNSGLTLGPNGSLYGTTVYGGGSSVCSSGCGIVFQLSGAGGNWTETILHTFQGGSDGEQPFNSAMALGPDGSLYGDTLFGGRANSGTVFQLSPPSAGGKWKESVLYAFPGGKNGAVPESNMLLDASGTLYGTTSQGGTTGCGGAGCGTVYALTPPAAGEKRWQHVLLYKFHGGKDGATPIAGLTEGAGGVLYGTTSAGGGGSCGGTGCGTVFSLTPSGAGEWTETLLHRFKKKKNGLTVFNSLLIDAKGNLYGSTTNGGKGTCGGGALIGCGMDFELSPPAGGSGEWTETDIHIFIGKKPGGFYDGAYPNGALIADTNGALYGSTYGGGYPCPICAGTVYKLTPPANGATTWNESILYPFQAGSDGTGPQGGLVASAGGVLYGVTAGGGSANLGTAFAVTP